MTISNVHATTGTIADDPSAQINKTEWNAEHTLTMATNNLLGRGTAGAGVVEEITLGTNLSFTGTTLNAAGGGGSADMLSVLTGATIAVTTSTTLTIGRMHLVSGAGALTETLPAAAGNTDKFIGIEISNTNLVTIDGNASETIDGALTRIMWAGETAILHCDGSNWVKVAGKTIPMTASMYMTAAQTLTTPAAATITFDTVAVDNTGLMALTGAHTLTAKRGGNYLIDAYVMVGPSTTGANVFTQVNAVKGASTNILDGIGPGAVASGYISAPMSGIVVLAAGDAVHITANLPGETLALLIDATHSRFSMTEIPAW